MVSSLMVIQMTISWFIIQWKQFKVFPFLTQNHSFLKHSYSWSGQRKMPTDLHRLVFPENFLTALRTIAMLEDELFQVSSLLEELVRSGEGRQSSDSEVRAAVWEACGDSGASQLLVDLLNVRLTDLLESSGTEDSDTNLLENTHC